VTGYIFYFIGGSIAGCPEGILGSFQFTPSGSSKSCTFKITRGDYSKLMSLVAENLEKAKVSVLFVWLLNIFVN